MTRTFDPCENCLDSLRDINNTVSLLWLSLCDLADPEEPFVSFELGGSMLQKFLMDISILEDHGFVVSHEAGKSPLYIVKVLGYDRGCICVRKH